MQALETPHRGAGGIPEVKVVGNGHCHGKVACAVSTLLFMIPYVLVTENCKRVKGVWLCFGGGGCVTLIRKQSVTRFLIYDP